MPAEDLASGNEAGQSLDTTYEDSSPAIDLEALARIIYELLKQEARIEAERLGRPRNR
jgi:hypothetical protein